MAPLLPGEKNRHDREHTDYARPQNGDRYSWNHGPSAFVTEVEKRPEAHMGKQHRSNEPGETEREIGTRARGGAGRRLAIIDPAESISLHHAVPDSPS